MTSRALASLVLLGLTIFPAACRRCTPAVDAFLVVAEDDDSALL